MKYSLLALLFIIGIFVQAYDPTTDLDKPFSGTTGVVGLQIAKSATSAYMKNWTIQQIVDRILGREGVSCGDYTSNVLTYRIASASGLRNQGQYWTNAWDTDYTATDDVADLVTELSNYVDKFPASSQLLSASLSNGHTVTFNEYKDVPNADVDKYSGDYVYKENNEDETKNVYTRSDSNKDSLSAVAGTDLTIYAGRYTTANNNITEEVTVATANHIYHVYAYDTSTPIVLDLDGDGNLEASKGQHLPHTLCVPESELVAFDINADGFEELVEWVGANDGLLVHDIVNNEVSAKNLFGDATGFKNGFEQLATLDANKDGALTGEELAGLSVWQDKNGNAKIDDGEIHTLESLGITKLNVEAIELTATFERNGKYYKMWDWNPVTIMVKKAK